jgi:hypothetical protein
MRKLNSGEQRLVAELGVYGIWILKHGHSLNDEDFLVVRIKSAYQQYITIVTNNSIKVLFDSIDNFCNERGFECPGRNYDEALKDLLGNTSTDSV